MSEKEKNLYYLDELSDYKVASDDCDVRGWKVKDADNRTIGKVDDLLVNKATERVVYLDVEVNDELIMEENKTFVKQAGEGVQGTLNNDGDDHLFIPVGLVTLDEENEIVLAGAMNSANFATTNRVSKRSAIDRKHEIALMRNYILAAPNDEPNDVSDNFYNSKEFENHLRRRKI